MLTCICLKYGDRFGPEYPNRLYAGLKRHSTTDVRLICVTDDRTGIRPEIEVIPLELEPFFLDLLAEMKRRNRASPFRKVHLYKPGLVPDHSGPLILLDIDVVIVGNMNELAAYAPGKVCMRYDWDMRPGSQQFGHGSVEKFDPELHGYIYETLRRNPIAAIDAYSHQQVFTSRTADKAGDFLPYPNDWIVSFKHDCRPIRPLNLILRPRLPPGARVVCFHGRPKMAEAVNGYDSDPLHSIRPASWLREAWLGSD